MIDMTEQSQQCVVFRYTHRDEMAEVIERLYRVLKEQHITCAVSLIYLPPGVSHAGEVTPGYFGVWI